MAKKLTKAQIKHVRSEYEKMNQIAKSLHEYVNKIDDSEFDADDSALLADVGHASEIVMDVAGDITAYLKDTTNK